VKKVLKFEAKSKNEAISLAREKWKDSLGDKFNESNISVSLEQEKKGFLGLGTKKKIYKVVYSDTISKSEEDFLDVAVETISVDGSFQIKIIDDGVYLKVSKPQGQGKIVDYSDIKLELDYKEIVEVDLQKIREIVAKGEDEWGIIAPRKPELDREAELTVTISDDKMKAFVSYMPALGGKKLSKEDCRSIIMENGVVFNIDDDKIDKLVNKKAEVESVLIAEGIPPIPGKDASLNYHFENKMDSIGTKREDGSMDFFDLGLITNVNPGDVLVTKNDAEVGTAGKGVTGEEIPPPKAKDIKLPKGKNTEIKDENTLIAKTAGQVVFDERERIQVLPVHEVRGDVDLSTGNIDFIGNVIISGDVTEGFSIKAAGNVEVRGNVSIADIEADGDVIIQHGFIGKNKSKINAKGNVKALFVENAYIKAGKDIIIGDAAMHSQLISGNNIKINEKKGLLVGGVSKARSKIEANVIGSSLATTTKLEAGVDPELKLKIKKTDEEINKAKINLVKAIKAIKILEKYKEQNDGLPEKKVLMLYQLQKTEQQLNSSIENNEELLLELQAKLRVSEHGYIQAKKKIYPGTKMTIGNAQLNIHNEMAGSKFIEQDGDITQLSIGW